MEGRGGVARRVVSRFDTVVWGYGEEEEEEEEKKKTSVCSEE